MILRCYRLKDEDDDGRTYHNKEFLPKDLKNWSPLPIALGWSF